MTGKWLNVAKCVNISSTLNNDTTLEIVVNIILSITMQFSLFIFVR